MRKKTKRVKVGKLFIGGDAPVTVQSMCNMLTKDADATIKQIHGLEEAGCEIVRVSVPDIESANSLKKIKENINIPIVADIHFDYKLALESAKYVDKLRINPGNIGSEEKIKQVVSAAKEHGLPIRIGVNLGSLEKELEKQYGLTPKAMVESALKNISLLEKFDFHEIIVSLKASDVVKTIEAYKMFSEKSDYPLHLGITEAGTMFSGTVASSVGIGSLLLDGIGDTIRVSLSAPPVEEVRVGKQILSSVGLRQFGVKVLACPTCARANFDVSTVAKEVEERTQNIKKPMTIAVMGCGVNGPGEAKEADIGIVGGKPDNLFYKKGVIAGRVGNEDVVRKLMDEIIK